MIWKVHKKNESNNFLQKEFKNKEFDGANYNA